MKKINFLILIFTFLLTSFTISTVKAQNEFDSEEPDNPQQVRPVRIFQELGLTQEQIQQIRQIHNERRPIMQEAQRNWRQASFNLDSAIYSDDSTEEEVKRLLKEAQMAQAELLKQRAMTEYMIRKVLTPEQLQKFRQLREQFMRRNNERNKQPNRPFNRNPQQRLQNRQRN